MTMRFLSKQPSRAKGSAAPLSNHCNTVSAFPLLYSCRNATYNTPFIILPEKRGRSGESFCGKLDDR